MIKYIFWGGVIALLLTACGKKAPKQQPLNFGTEIYDSAALHVALIPSKDCLPIYYAQQKGIYSRLGLKIQIASYNSQLDCDTALLGNMADGGIADGIRLKYYGKRAEQLQPMWKSSSSWQLFVCNNLRIKNTKALKGRTIGIARNSAANTVLDSALKNAGIWEKDVYRPQINNMKLRAEMLDGGQIDAAVLSWPYTQLAQSAGHRSIYTYRDSSTFTCFVKHKAHAEKDKVKKQWELFEKGRQMAIDSLKIKGPEAYSSILQKEYGLPKEIADTLHF